LVCRGTDQGGGAKAFLKVCESTDLGNGKPDIEPKIGINLENKRMVMVTGR